MIIGCVKWINTRFHDIHGATCCNHWKTGFLFLRLQKSMVGQSLGSGPLRLKEKMIFKDSRRLKYHESDSGKKGPSWAVSGRRAQTLLPLNSAAHHNPLNRPAGTFRMR